MKSIAIDGPAGAGKSTIAKIAAKELGYVYVDTGAMYRAMALWCIRRGVDEENEAAVSAAVAQADVSIDYDDGAQIVILNGENVNAYIRTEEVGMASSRISKYAAVRNRLLELQRGVASSKDVIMDGRDIGTCVLPKADTKIYLTAGVRVRAERRYRELLQKGVDCDIDQIEKDIAARDRQDMEREIAPLRQARDAIRLDTSDMTADEAAMAVVDIHKGKENGRR